MQSYFKYKKKKNIILLYPSDEITFWGEILGKHLYQIPFLFLL